jgi:predicted RecA/RadA family phage recombinase
MKNYVQEGTTITLTTPSGGLLSGNGVLIGNIFGVANFDSLAAAPCEIDVEGVFDLLKSATVTFAEGALAYWDNTAKSVTSVATANKLIGAATKTAGASDVTVRVRLNESTVV